MFKKIQSSLIFILAIFLFFTWNNFNVYAIDVLSVKNLDVILKVNDNTSEAEYIENFKVHFDLDRMQKMGIKKHGLERWIPLDTVNIMGMQIPREYEIEKITDDKGNLYNYYLDKTDGKLDIKIGEKDKYIDKADYQYNIYYKVDKFFSHYKDADELYYNIVGDEWDTTMDHVNFKFDLSAYKNIPWDQVQLKCWVGKSGSTEANKGCNIKIDKDNKIIFAQTTRKLQPHEAFTVKVHFPAGTLVLPKLSWWEKLRYFLIKYRLSFTGLFFLIFTFYLIRAVYPEYRRRKDFVSIYSAEYKAIDNLQPAEVYFLLGGSINYARVITAEIVHLAINKYIKITDIQEGSFLSKSSFKLQLLKPDYLNDDKLESYQKELLSKIFDGNTLVDNKELKKKLENYLTLGHFSKSVSKVLREKGYFEDYGYNKYVLKAFLFLVIIFILGFFEIQNFGATYVIIFMLLDFFFMFAFPSYLLRYHRYSEKGLITYRSLLGLKKYIKLAEKDRLAFEELKKLYEKLLPYAIVFGYLKAWLKLMQDIYAQEGRTADWIDGSSTLALGSVVGSIDRTVRDASRSSSSSGGMGGSSGGGGGGGGGGSW